MMKRVLCALCALCLVLTALPALSEDSSGSYSFDFDLVFSLNAEAFPAALRARAAGYAALAERIGLKGNLAWTTETASMELDATLYYLDKPSLTYPFRIYGTESRIFITSPLINNEVLLLNNAALMEFCVKAKNTLGLPLPYLAFLLPICTNRAFLGLHTSWQETIGPYARSGEVPQGAFMELSEKWIVQLMENTELQRWISALANGSKSPSIVEEEFSNLPYYYESVTRGQPLLVRQQENAETWQDSLGNTLFSREESDTARSMDATLTPSGNGYIPSAHYRLSTEGERLSLSLQADAAKSTAVQPAPAPAENADAFAPADAGSASPAGEYDEEYDVEGAAYGAYGEDEEEPIPDRLLFLSVDVDNFPLALPAEGSFSVETQLLGALFPNFSVRLLGETKKDGSVLLAALKPDNGETEPVEISRCSGTLVPAQARAIPDYQQKDLTDTYNIFSFNETSLESFSRKVLPPLIRSVFTFVEEAPTAACQSLLDDLTDAGLLDFLLY